MKKTRLYAALLISTALFLALPGAASASSIYIESTGGVVSAQDTIVLKVYADTDGPQANAIDGTLSLSLSSSAFTIKDINLAGSVFTLWPHTPAASADGKSISFTGGIPGGFSGNHQLLFSIAVMPQTPGTLSVAPGKSVLYLNDGKGTGVALAGRTLTIPVMERQAGVPPRDEWQSTIADDTTPPDIFTPVGGQDPSVFGGKKYIFFQTQDHESGIDHYTVSENGGAAVQSGNTYILKNQTGPVSLVVYAYDKAGNARAAAYSEGVHNTVPVILIILVLLIVLALACIWFMIKRMRKA